MSDDFDLAHDKLPDQPVTIGGDKSAAAWHPNHGPEVPHADLIARLREAQKDALYYGRNGWSGVLRDAADALAALGDTVPSRDHAQMRRLAEGANRLALQRRNQRDESRAERDALALQDNRVRHILASGYEDVHDALTDLQEVVNTVPAISLALHDAEVKAQALDEFREEVLGQAGHLTEAGYYSGVASWPDSRASAYSTAIDEVEALATARAAAIRSGAN